MDELDLFREFRQGVADPSADARRRASARLTTAIEDQLRWRAGIPQLLRRRPGRIVLTFAALAGATAAALFVSAPWQSSPGFLERAQAALTPPAGTVLHTKWAWTLTAADSSCTVTRGPNEMWIDQSPPHRYRGVLKFSAPDPQGVDPSMLVCALGPPLEGGGALDTHEGLVFEPPDRLRSTGQGFFGPPDPVAMLRRAISNGSAHDEGTTELDGRTVERIRVDSSECPGPRCGGAPTYYYVDPETYYPVRIEESGVGPGNTRFDSVVGYLVYEYLPGSPANRALADIRAQHPNATGP